MIRGGSGSRGCWCRTIWPCVRSTARPAIWPGGDRGRMRPGAHCSGRVGRHRGRAQRLPDICGPESPRAHGRRAARVARSRRHALDPSALARRAGPVARVMRRCSLQIVVAAVPVDPGHHTARDRAWLCGAGARATTRAKRMGRLSLNPLRHMDRFGTLILPGHPAAAATRHDRPGRVHVRLGQAGAGLRLALPDPRRGMMLVAAARAGDELPARLARRAGALRDRRRCPVLPAAIAGLTCSFSDQSRARTVQPAADPAARRRPDRGRAAAEAACDRLGAARAGRDRHRAAAAVLCCRGCWPKLVSAGTRSVPHSATWCRGRPAGVDARRPCDPIDARMSVSEPEAAVTA